MAQFSKCTSHQSSAHGFPPASLHRLYSCMPCHTACVDIPPPSSPCVPAGGLKQKKPRRKGEVDRLDKLAAEYRAKYFDGGKKVGGEGKKGGAQRPAAVEQLGLKRWFD